MCKTEGISPNKFRNDQNPIELFKGLTDGNINPKKVLKVEFDFKSDLGEIKKGHKISESKDQVRVIQMFQYFFN